MKKLSFLNTFFGSLIILLLTFNTELYSTEKVQIKVPHSFAGESIQNIKTNNAKKVLESIQEQIKKSEKSSSLKYLAKAYLLNRLSEHSSAIKAALKAGFTPINDLKFYILASSYFEKGLSQKSLLARSEDLRKATQYFNRIIMEFENSPFYEKSLKEFDRSKLMLAHTYYENKKISRAISLYKSIILSYESQLSQDQFCGLYLNLGTCFMRKKRYYEAFKAFSEVASYNPMYPGLKEKESELFDLIPDSEVKLKKLVNPSNFGVSGVISTPLDLTKEDKRIYSQARDFSLDNKHEETIVIAGKLLSLYPGSEYKKETSKLVLKSIKKIISSAKKSIRWGSHYKNNILTKNITILYNG